MLSTLIGIAVFVYLAFALLLYFTQSQLLYLPHLPGRELLATPAQYGMDYEDIELVTEDGETLHGWFVPAAAAATDGPASVLIFHGNAGNISHRLETLRLWHELGLGALIFDYRGYGRSTGRPTEAGTYRDARAAWRFLTEQRAIPAQRIVIFGRSLGGSIAAQLAVEAPAAGLIVESAFTSVPDIAAELYRWLPVRYLSRFRYDTRAAIRQVRCPILVVHSRDDEIISYAHGVAIHAAAPEPKHLLEIRGGHNDGFLRDETLYRRGLADFLATLRDR